MGVDSQEAFHPAEHVSRPLRLSSTSRGPNVVGGCKFLGFCPTLGVKIVAQSRAAGTVTGAERARSTALAPGFVLGASSTCSASVGATRDPARAGRPRGWLRVRRDRLRARAAGRGGATADCIFALSGESQFR